jgi:antitoxin YefM
VDYFPAVKTISYTEARNRLAGLMEDATRDREPITITRNGAGTVVLLDAGEFAAMEETLHLLSTPANAERIRQGLSDHAAGKFKAGELCD